ncbi:Adenylate kinase [Thalassobacillus cyri]|uniref:Adenylate kinase n=1 Tax=Thalassobacillus cyri TaxID=571932 RepID=A0A1H3ZNS7_9BACI|nr:topology modulation protein [Thalassobacillus cyri]SEA25295.1 Adenylate kinase [Thalassobacillus cyri]
MKRIMVLGVSAGVGKSTFARKMGEALQLNVYHLDALYWKPGWVEASLEEFKDAQREIVKKENWIIEGNYSKTFDIRSKRADTIIYLELPRYICLYRAVKRWLMNIGKTRSDMGAECKEKLDWEFLKYIYTTYKSRKRNMKERLHTLQIYDHINEIIYLRSKYEIKSYLDSLQREKDRSFIIHS